MSILLTVGAAAFLPVVAISAQDERLDSQRTYVSPSAELVLAADEGEVYCLDRGRRERYRSICLTKGEWEQAITLAEAQPAEGPRAIVPQKYRAPNQPVGLSRLRAR